MSILNFVACLRVCLQQETNLPLFVGVVSLYFLHHTNHEVGFTVYRMQQSENWILEQGLSCQSH